MQKFQLEISKIKTAKNITYCDTGCEYTMVIIFFCNEQLLFFVYDKTPKLFNYELEMLADITATKLHLVMDVLQTFMIISFLVINFYDIFKTFKATN